jgi:hypothetical protein
MWKKYLNQIVYGNGFYLSYVIKMKQDNPGLQLSEKSIAYPEFELSTERKGEK